MTFSEEAKAVLLGIVQGFTEFLPVSSSGHLVVFSRVFKLPALDLLFVLVLHLGSLMAILSYYKKELAELFKYFFKKPFDFSSPGGLLPLAAVATLPGLLGALLLKDLVEKSLSRPDLTGLFFIVSGVFLFCTRAKLKKTAQPLKTPSFLSAILIGFSQVLAFFPGMSRSGLSIATALFLNWPKKQAVFFSFLLAIPAITGGFLWEVFKEWEHLQKTPPKLLSLSLAFFSSWLFGLIALKCLVRSLQKLFFPFFALYLWPLGLFSLLYL